MLNIPVDREGNTTYTKLEAYLGELEDSLESLEELEERSDEDENKIEELKIDIEELKQALKYVDSCANLIHEDNIRQYIQDLTEDSYTIDPYLKMYIDWDMLVDDALDDYSSVDINGELYYFQ